MTDEDYVIEKSRTPSDLVDKIIEPILSLVGLAVLYFFGIDWLLDPVISFVSQFEWFDVVIGIGDYLSSVIEWLDSLNTDGPETDSPGTDGPSLPFGLTRPFGGLTIDVIVALGELVVGIAVVVTALNTTIVAIRSEGVTIRDVSVPWSSIRQVEIVQPESSASESEEVEVGLRLDPDASLPEDWSSLDIDSSTPSEIPSPLSTFLDSQLLDRECLVAAAHRFAPESVSIIENRGDTERELEPEGDVL